MSHTEDGPEVSRYPIDLDRAKKKLSWVRSTILGGDPLRVVAIEVTHRIGDIERTVRYELDGGEPVEIWEHKGEVYIIPMSDAEAGRFPWKDQT